MIKKVDIQKFGLFKDFQWKNSFGAAVDAEEFKQLNIIYGRNYSGKTTLSRIFRSIELGYLPKKYSDGVFCIVDTDDSKITQINLHTNDKIRVYNSDFVKENLSWLYDDINGDIKPFTLLGSGNVIAEKRIIDIDTELGSIDRKTGLLYNEDNENRILIEFKDSFKKEQSRIENLLKNKANLEIKVNKYFIEQGTNYNITNIKHEIEEIIKSEKSHLLEENQIIEKKKIIDESKKPNITEFSIVKPQIHKYIERVKELVEKKITLTNTLQELVTDSLLQEWVNKGRVHHKNKRDFCAFCGNPISKERWESLDAHFSKESEELKIELEKQKTTLEKAKTAIVEFLNQRGIIKESFYTPVHKDFDTLKAQWDETVNLYFKSIDLLINKIEERYKDIFTPCLMVEVADVSDIIEKTLIEFNNLSKKNNENTETLTRDKDNARKELRYSEIEKFILAINYKSESTNLQKKEIQIKEKIKELSKISENIKNLNKEKQIKELEKNDEGEAAKKINNHLVRFFGHNGLSLEPEKVENTEEVKGRFIIKRGLEKAYNLSEGECSLISFCYFIAKMEDELNDPNPSNLIIYIDDPISSLDNNHVFFVFSLIETIIARDKKYGQLFISTHNLDFLKYIKRLTTPCNESKPSIAHFVIEKKKKDIEAKCNIISMPNYLKDYVTEYNFLFKEIYDMAKPIQGGNKAKCIEHTFTNFYNLPNNMRKFLECYLFYRYPNTDTPLLNMNKLFDNNIPALVNRVINEYSHLSWGNRGSLVLDVAEAEDVSKIILKTIKQKDKSHFDALCDSIKVNKEVELNISI
jgi:wobble nucleotide-excising tRNase